MEKAVCFIFVCLLALFLGVEGDCSAVNCRSVVIPGHALYGLNDKILESIPVGECYDRCLAEQEFQCQSFDYNPVKQICYLSKSSRITDPEEFGCYRNSDYYDIDCGTFGQRCEKPKGDYSIDIWVPTVGIALSGFNSIVTHGKLPVTECFETCYTKMTVPLLSIDLWIDQREADSGCFCQDASKKTNPEKMYADARNTYFEKTQTIEGVLYIYDANMDLKEIDQPIREGIAISAVGEPTIASASSMTDCFGQCKETRGCTSVITNNEGGCYFVEYQELLHKF